jgi:hypothetical protein
LTAVPAKLRDFACSFFLTRSPVYSFGYVEEEGVCPSQFVIFPDQTGTATSSPKDTTASLSINIVNVMIRMKEKAYEESTIRNRSASALRSHLCAERPRKSQTVRALKVKRTNLFSRYDSISKLKEIYCFLPWDGYQCLCGNELRHA